MISFTIKLIAKRRSYQNDYKNSKNEYNGKSLGMIELVQDVLTKILMVFMFSSEV